MIEVSEILEQLARQQHQEGREVIVKVKYTSDEAFAESWGNATAYVTIILPESVAAELERKYPGAREDALR